MLCQMFWQRFPFHVKFSVKQRHPYASLQLVSLTILTRKITFLDKKGHTNTIVVNSGKMSSSKFFLTLWHKIVNLNNTFCFIAETFVEIQPKSMLKSWNFNGQDFKKSRIGTGNQTPTSYWESVNKKSVQKDFCGDHIQSHIWLNL